MQTGERRALFSSILGGGIEAMVLLMVVVAPWLFAGVHPLAQLFLHVFLALILLLWAARMAVEGRLLWNPCGVSMGLAALCVLAIIQLAPMSHDLLLSLSPGTAGLYDQLQPSVQETLRAGPGETPIAPPSTLSVVPFATGNFLIQVMAVLALFAAVRANLPSPATLHRLAIVVVVNGVLLSLLALAQFFSSPRNVVFWTFPSQGQVFGPFVCRNHFAYFINVSLGLGVGLLLSNRDVARATGSRSPSLLASLQAILQEPAVLWIASALAVMGAGLMCSFSRGGVLACLAGIVVCTFLKLWYSKGFSQYRSGLLLTGLGALAVFWLCFDYAGKRLATLWESNLLNEDRGPVWGRIATLVPKFPIWGTGLGTFRFVEPLTRLPTDGSGVLQEHAHNDYLEVLIEGGIINLGIVLAIIVVLIFAGIRCYRLLRETREGNFVLGCLFGLTAVLVHGTVDFGMHIPAVVVLTAVVAALMLNMYDWARRQPAPAAPAWHGSATAIRAGEPGAARGTVSSPSNGGLAAGVPAAMTGILALLCVAFFLLSASWRAEQAEDFRLAASLMSDADPRDKRIPYLDAGLAYTPNDPLLQLALAEAYRHRFQAKTNHLQTRLAAFQFAYAEPIALLSSLELARNMHPVKKGASDQADTDLDLAAQGYVRARSLTPLLVEPQLFLAAHPEVLAKGDTPEKYLERACRLDPSNPKIWYAAGQHALHAGDRARAWEDWRRSLECGDICLNEIVASAGDLLPAEQLARDVLPQNPDMLFRVAKRMEETGKAEEEIQTLNRSALACLKKDAPRAPEHVLLKARIQARLKLVPDACESYQQAIAQDPAKVGVRLEFSQFLVKAGQLAEAKTELLTVLSLQPGNGEANTEYALVERRLRLGETGPAKIVEPEKKEIPKATETDLVLATVRIFNRKQGKGVVGTGVIVAKDKNVAYVLTAAHVTDQADSLEVHVFSSRSLPLPEHIYPAVEIVRRRQESKQDLAILRIAGYQGESAGLPICKLQDLPPEDNAIAAFSVGCGNGRPPTVQSELIERSGFAPKTMTRLWSTARAPELGESGGPLVNSHGQILGICSGANDEHGRYCHLEDILAIIHDCRLQAMIK